MSDDGRFPRHPRKGGALLEKIIKGSSKVEPLPFGHRKWSAKFQYCGETYHWCVVAASVADVMEHIKRELGPGEEPCNLEVSEY